MILGIAEDFTSNVTLDSELTAIPDNGLYLNTGVHPSVTVNNLLSFLPILNLTIDDWSSTKSYGIYEDSRNKSDLVLVSGIIYQSLKAGSGQMPSTSPTYWLPTNIESLRLKSFINKIQDKVYADLRLTKRLVNNQYLYEVGEQTVQLPNNYCGWIFEPKGSDYLSFRINEIMLQKASAIPVNLYVINQGVLIDTLQITPKNGIVSFDKLDYKFSGKGRWIFAIDSTDVITNSGYLDALKYDGFIVYTCVGLGSSPESAIYDFSSIGNGLGFNISVILDSSVYLENNITDFGSYVRSTFELMTMQMFLANSNNRSNSTERIQMNENLLIQETRDLINNSSVSRYMRELKYAKKQLQQTFDTQLDDNQPEIIIGSV